MRAYRRGGALDAARDRRAAPRAARRLQGRGAPRRRGRRCERRSQEICAARARRDRRAARPPGRVAAGERRVSRITASTRTSSTTLDGVAHRLHARDRRDGHARARRRADGGPARADARPRPARLRRARDQVVEHRARGVRALARPRSAVRSRSSPARRRPPTSSCSRVEGVHGPRTARRPARRSG